MWGIMRKERNKIMRRIILYIAMSLDGYIADKDGGVEWLTGQDAETESWEQKEQLFYQARNSTIVSGFRIHQNSHCGENDPLIREAQR